MNKKLLVAALLAVSGTGAMAQAQANKDSGFYAELGLVQAYYNQSNPSVNFNNSMAAIKAGYNINKYAAAEVMAAGNLDSANFNYGSTNINAKVSNAYGAYGKFSLPIEDKFSLFVRLGVTSATVDASSRYGSAWSSGSDFSYGAGAQFNFTKDVYGQVDYMSYYNKNNITVQAPSISIGYKF
jgi:opacity protein-like surface antigen